MVKFAEIKNLWLNSFKIISAHDMEIKENREYFTKICEIIKFYANKD